MLGIRGVAPPQAARAGCALALTAAALLVVVATAAGRTGRLVGQGQQGVALGAGEAAAHLLAHKQPDKQARKQQAEEYGDRDDGHAWKCLRTA